MIWLVRFFIFISFAFVVLVVLAFVFWVNTVTRTERLVSCGSIVVLRTFWLDLRASMSRLIVTFTFFTNLVVVSFFSSAIVSLMSYCLVVLIFSRIIRMRLVSLVIF